MDAPTTLTYLDGNTWIEVVPKSDYDAAAEHADVSAEPTVLVYVGEQEVFDVVPKTEYDALAR